MYNAVLVSRQAGPRLAGVRALHQHSYIYRKQTAAGRLRAAQCGTSVIAIDTADSRATCDDLPSGDPSPEQVKRPARGGKPPGDAETEGALSALAPARVSGCLSCRAMPYQRQQRSAAQRNPPARQPALQTPLRAPYAGQTIALRTAQYGDNPAVWATQARRRTYRTVARRAEASPAPQIRVWSASGRDGRCCCPRAGLSPSPAELAQSHQHRSQSFRQMKW